MYKRLDSYSYDPMVLFYVARLIFYATRVIYMFCGYIFVLGHMVVVFLDWHLCIWGGLLCNPIGTLFP